MCKSFCNTSQFQCAPLQPCWLWVSPEASLKLLLAIHAPARSRGCCWRKCWEIFGHIPLNMVLNAPQAPDSTSSYAVMIYHAACSLLGMHAAATSMAVILRRLDLWSKTSLNRSFNSAVSIQFCLFSDMTHKMEGQWQWPIP